MVERSNISVSGVKKKDNSKRTIFEEIMGNIFFKLGGKAIEPYVEVLQTPSRIKEYHP